MLQLVLHDHPRELFQRFAAALAHLQRRDPLSPVTVLTPNPGIARWLQLGIAREHGICANVEFARPASFIWQRLRASSPELVDTAELDAETLRWAVFHCLHHGELPKGLLQGKAPGTPGDQLALAGLLGQVFNDYQLFDPERIARWEQHQETPPERAQAELWRAALAVATTPHAARLLAKLPDAARLGAQDAVLAFNIGDISPLYLHALQRLAEQTSLEVFLPVLSQEYWGDLDHRARREGSALGGAGLLAAFGRREKDLIDRLLNASETTQQDLESPELNIDANWPHTALGQVQQAVRLVSDALPEQLRERGLPDDHSLQLLASPSRLREVQVVRDAILKHMQRDTSLQAHEVLIMTPDVTGYLPYLQGVFADPALPAERRLSLNISDASLRDSHPLLELFAEWLRLPSLRMTASRLLRWLEEPAVQRAFELPAEDAQRLRDWLIGAGVRWGIDAADREQELDLAYGDYSWQAGLDRLLLGVMQADAETPIDGVYAYADIEGHAASAVGALASLMEQLASMRQDMQQARSASAWQHWWQAQLERLIDCDMSDDAEAQAWSALLKLLQSLDVPAQVLGDTPLDYSIIAQSLEAQLGGPGANRAFLGGGVSIAGMVPLRAVPARVVVLLGMNDDSFPRSDELQSLSLFSGEQRRRLLSKRDDDRLLFLQAMMAADDALILSYTSRHESTGETLAPSPAVSEWLAAIAELYGASAQAVHDQIAETHPLHVFSPAYARNQNEDQNKDKDQASASKALSSYDAPASDQSGHAPQVLVPSRQPKASTTETAPQSLRELEHRLRDPFGLWLAERGDLAVRNDHRRSEDDEPLMPLGTLETYGLNRALIEEAERQQLGAPRELDTADTATRLLGHGLLPPGAQARTALSAHLDDYGEWLRTVMELIQMRGVAKPMMPFEVAGLNVQISDARPGGLLRWQPSAFKYKHVLNWWLDALALTALTDEHDCQHTLVLRHGKKAKQYRLHSKAKQATDLLAELQVLAVSWTEQPPPLPRKAWDGALSDGLGKLIDPNSKKRPDDLVRHCLAQLHSSINQAWRSTQTSASFAVPDEEAWLAPWALRAPENIAEQLDGFSHQLADLTQWMAATIEVVQ